MPAGAKRKGSLCLYLAILCFAGIVAIFVGDGYMGVYDTLRVVVGEREVSVGPEYWLRGRAGESNPYYVNADWGDPIHFRYQLDNRRFSPLPVRVKASVWKGGESAIDLLVEEETVGSFDRLLLEWVVDSEELASRGLDTGEYTVRLEREGVVREVVIGYLAPPPQPVYPLRPSAGV